MSNQILASNRSSEVIIVDSEIIEPIFSSYVTLLGTGLFSKINSETGQAYWPVLFGLVEFKFITMSYYPIKSQHISMWRFGSFKSRMTNHQFVSLINCAIWTRFCFNLFMCVHGSDLDSLILRISVRWSLVYINRNCFAETSVCLVNILLNIPIFESEKRIEIKFC